jgi:hypothetical protein
MFRLGSSFEALQPEGSCSGSADVRGFPVKKLIEYPQLDVGY